MYLRIFLAMLPLFFVACSAIERKPNCIHDDASPEIKCEKLEKPNVKAFRGGYRERP